MEIDSDGRFVMHSDDEPITPKGVTVSGDIGHVLYLKPGLTLDEIIKGLEGTEWLKDREFISAVLQDYINVKHVAKDEETGKYDMTELGIASFLSGWW